MPDCSDNKNAKTNKIGDLLVNNSQKKTTNNEKRKNKTDAPNYNALKQREYHKRKYANDKSCWKRCFYAVEINGKKYYFMSPKDIKWEKVPRKLIENDIEQICVKAF